VADAGTALCHRRTTPPLVRLARRSRRPRSGAACLGWAPDSDVRWGDAAAGVADEALAADAVAAADAAAVGAAGEGTHA
jgi:hypothetical protein